MNRSAALRAFGLFVIGALVFACIGFASQAPLAEILFLVSGSLCALMLAFALIAPSPKAVPVRVRKRH